MKQMIWGHTIPARCFTAFSLQPKYLNSVFSDPVDDDSSLKRDASVSGVINFEARNPKFGFGFIGSRFSWKYSHLVFAVLLVSLIAAGAALALPTYQEVRAAHRPSDALLLDRNGEVLHELRTDLSVRRLGWVSLEEVSPALREAVVRAEDKRFFDHTGVDWQALAAAGLRGISSGTWRGASTISMQLAAQLDGELQSGQGRRSLTQKWRQVQAARHLETTWSKADILEAYLNLVFFRREYQGAEAACRGLFGKAAHGMNAAESLVLASLIRSPNAATDQVADRAVRLQKALGWPGREEDLRQTALHILEPYNAHPAAGRPCAACRPATDWKPRPSTDRGMHAGGRAAAVWPGAPGPPSRYPQDAERG